MLSQRSRYALRAMMILAANTDDLPMRTGEIARAAGIPSKFLEAILLQMRKAGLLISHRGRKGGFRLARPATGISFADIVSATDGAVALAPCANEAPPRICEDCRDLGNCAIRKALMQIREKTTQVLRGYALDVACEVRECGQWKWRRQARPRDSDLGAGAPGKSCT